MTSTRYGAIKHDVGIFSKMEMHLTAVLKLLEQKPDCVEARNKVEEMMTLVTSLTPYQIDRSTSLSPQLDRIMTETSTLDLNTLLKEGKLVTKVDNTDLNMISFPGQVQLLQFFVRIINAKNILEVGTFTGYGAFGMAEVMAPGGKVTGIEIEPVFCDLVRKRAREYNLNVEVIQGKAIDVLKSLAKEGQQFDMIYVDCIKTEYLEYYQIIMDNNMLSPNGLIVCDNVMWSGKAITRSDSAGSALDDFTQAVVQDKRVVSLMLPCFDGTLLIQHNHDKND